MLYSPSVYAHILSGALLMFGILYIVLHSSRIMRNPYTTILLLFVVSIATGIHGISHAVLESVYNYNPLDILRRRES